jgi:2-polyprenyl-3-methyl-5-hydroxy-6-metoxy-1,4-benzoquinol methylase
MNPQAHTSSGPPNPATIFDLINGYIDSACLKGAVELEIFTIIAEGVSTAGAIAARAKASERGIRILCDFLTVRGLLTKSGSEYGLAEASAVFLSKKSPAYMGDSVHFLLHESHMQNFRDVASTVRKGGSLDSLANMAPENPIWVEFARSMVGLVAGSSNGLGERLARKGEKIKVLDIAAGHGMFGIAVARHNPQATVVAVDWKPVLEVAKENAHKAGVADRYQTIPGSAFDVDFGTGYDLVLLPNFLHHFDIPTNTTFLKKVRAAMNKGGLVATPEFVPNPDRVTPPAAAAFSMMMLASTPAGDAYTLAEYDSMFRAAGFGASRQEEFPKSPEQLILTEV